ncbi:hypothetical protein BGLA2_1720058 [Burkholderia gladioli]|nr:hypothetical protein BGLA2_1720058 [Burkholderia gladioli]
MHAAIPRVLGKGTQPKIGPSIVKSIAVYMINLKIADVAANDHAVHRDCCP